ncbi:hypothetical protein L6164_015630 [Bauhinia variegata]|uniref:Uncharacterized protein n=1 Tax=Bauhinia variegata TaxID=167791 RepID=A0ACB9NKU8_BAUVA|nr:hypothetical protein L6164_015630 [Bauhinia variegata]
MAPLSSINQFLNLFIFSLLLLLSFRRGILAKPNPSALTKSKYLKVPLQEFENSMNSAMKRVRSVVSVMSNTKYVSNANVNATADCLELLDSAWELLDCAITALQNHGETEVDCECKTGDVISDVKSWLSGALTNLATCIDELSDTNHISKDSVSPSMHQLEIILHNLSAMVKPQSTNSGTPSWVEPHVLRLIQADDIKPNITVAADGSGNFTSITQATQTAPNKSQYPYLIYVKKGIYNEYIEIKKNLWNIYMIGDGINQTIITGNHSNATGWTTFRSATFAVRGQNFVAINITFENTAGEEGNQAVALRSDSCKSIFYQCEMRGYQDTLYPHRAVQFYKNCKIRGTVDFIFGDGTVVFQGCEILSRQRRLSVGGYNTITAQGRKFPENTTGFSFHMCNITGDSDLMSSLNRTRTYLGRPWKSHARVVIMESNVSDIVHPAGWAEMDPTYDSTVFYGEYKNNGLGSGVTGRVKWPGVHVNIGKNTANNFTVSVFIKGHSFIPSSNIPYVPGLES